MIRVGELTGILILLLLKQISKAGCQSLSIKPHGTQIKEVGSSIKFTCLVDELSGARAQDVKGLTWIGPDHRQVRNTQGRVYVESHNSTNLRLYVTKISDNDSGLYACEAIINGKTVRAETRMFLIEDIRFDNTPQFVQHDIGSSPVLACRAHGQPQPDITWRFNGRKITSDNVKYVVEKEGLRINKLDLRDNGQYECRASVESLGTLKIYNITVDVLYAPVIKSKPQSGQVIQGQSYELMCDAHGNPPVSYAWFREKQNFGIHLKLKLNSVVEGRFLIRNMSGEDEGRYFCKASNDLGDKEVRVDVIMLVPPRITEVSKKTVVEGQKLELTCRTVDGVPAPSFTWLRGNTSDTAVPIKVDGRRVIFDTTHSNISRLVIQDLERGEAGQYWCRAENVAGADIKPTTVIVEYVPSVVVTTPMEQWGWPGQTRIFRCVGRGIPAPTLSWTRSGQSLAGQKGFSVKTDTDSDSVTSSLEIEIDLRFAGLYTSYSCIASNRHGYMMETVSLKEAYTPEKPHNVSVLEEGPTWATIRADPPTKDGGLRVDGWMVTYERISTNPYMPPSTANQLFKEGGNITVSGLIPDTLYTFYLAAGNAVGFGKPIDFRVQTPAVNAPLQPRSAGGSNLFREQSDVPAGDGDYPKGDSDDSDKKNPQDVIMSHSPGASTINTGGMSNLLLAAAIGIAAVLVAIITAIVCVAFSRGNNKGRRKSPNGSARNHNGTLRNGISGPILPEQIIHTTLNREGMIPDVVANGNATLGRRSVPTSPHAARACRVDKSPSSTPNTLRRTVGPPGTDAQRQAWDTMLMKAGDIQNQQFNQQLILENSGADVRPLSISELPPPPDFLLDTDTVSCLAHEIQDGYRSGDSVDDDIDDVDYTIRAPSYVR